MTARTDTVQIRIIDGELAGAPTTRRTVWSRLRTSPLADDLRSHGYEIAACVTGAVFFAYGMKPAGIVLLQIAGAR